MKNRILRTAVVAMLGFTLLAGWVPTRVVAKGSVDTASEGRAGDITGVWINQVTRRNCDTGAVIESFQTQTTFAKGGTYLETIAPSVFRSYGNGVWHRNSGDEYSLTHRFMRYDAAGAFIGSAIVRATIVVDSTGDGYTSTARNDILSPSGTVLASGCATTAATRLAQD